MTNRLQWDVLVSAQIPVITSDLPPGASEMKMVAHFFDAYFGQARCRVGGHGDYGRSKPETCRLDRAQRQEFDGNLRNPRPRRSFLWRKHNPEEISEGAVRRDERSHRRYAEADVGSCG